MEKKEVYEIVFLNEDCDTFWVSEDDVLDEEGAYLKVVEMCIEIGIDLEYYPTPRSLKILNGHWEPRGGDPVDGELFVEKDGEDIWYRFNS